MRTKASLLGMHELVDRANTKSLLQYSSLAAAGKCRIFARSSRFPPLAWLGVNLFVHNDHTKSISQNKLIHFYFFFVLHCWSHSPQNGSVLEATECRNSLVTCSPRPDDLSRSAKLEADLKRNWEVNFRIQLQNPLLISPHLCSSPF